VRGIRAFLGLAGFYRRLIPKFAEIAKPLTELTKKDFPFRWGERQETAFSTLKRALTSEQVLAYPDFKSEFILTTDASKTAAAAILSQVQEGVERPIAYASRQLNTAERNYSATELELLALTWATKHFRCYLLSKPFRVCTDHAALRYLRTFSDTNPRLMRWSLRLSEMDFTVQHRPGSKIPHVDSLSRCVQTVTSGHTISKERIRKEQEADPFCKSLDTRSTNAKAEYFVDQDGVIYRRPNRGEPQLVVPRSLVTEIIALNHDPIYSAHPGRKRTHDTIRLRYWCPGMGGPIDKYVRECDSCRRRKHRREYRAPLGKTYLPSHAFQL
jgi:hypothetical protein